MKNLQGTWEIKRFRRNPMKFLHKIRLCCAKAFGIGEGRGKIHAADTDGCADGCCAVVGDAMHTRIPDLGNQAPAPQLGNHAAGATGAPSVLPLLSRRVRVQLPLLPLSMTVLESLSDGRPVRR